ncbi:hypothetical protein C1T31_06160 [Hanstruepera neustonica]|uniref:Sulfotransferase domain-containing protein n=1 Tax=Hanstruepera neustonica TaxID=1445657 RepID=A0A2K1E0W2_9FLAO|nr:alkaline phosphatase family protein [Hanstruepera neustonica]PNQ73905.1 hypothetical protein C1T31_06160 [Hanstruepera neustonica]
MKKNKVLLIGWDAADWEIIGPLLAKGQMPSLKELIDKGVYGNMSTMNPPYSPMLWSSVATGKTPDKHGILGFIEVHPNKKSIRPVTVNSRKCRALWNILHNQGYKSNLVGWWPSFPAEPINGTVVSDRFQKVKSDPKERNPIIEGTIHPSEFTKTIRDLRMFPYEITEAHILPFIPKANEINQEVDKGLQSFAKIMAENTSIHAAATYIARNSDWNFMGVYFDLIDHFCHAFMKFHPPKQPEIPQKIFEIYKGAVEGAYRFQDMMLGRMMELVDEETTIIVMSDHGYESGHKRILKMPKYPAAPALEHRQFGIFVAAGPNIKKNEKVFGLGLIDVAPTILHMFDLPIGKDMDGKPALDIFENPKEPSFIDSWESVDGDFGEHPKTNNQDIFDEEETIEQLVDLGYIERPDENIEIAVLKTKSDLKHNLARVHLGKKNYDQAKQLLFELISAKYPVYDEDAFQGKNKESLKKQGYKVGDSVVNIIPYYMDLLNISLAEKEFDKARLYFNELKRRDKKNEIGLDLAESKILYGENKPFEALNILLNKKKNKPSSEIWYQIGKIYRGLSRFEEARDSFVKALEIEVDKAKLHQALAETLIRLGEYEEAAEHALTSIELVKYYPEAHYTLGEALEKLGDLENAKIAYNMASKLKPKAHDRAELAIENIQGKLEQKDKLKNRPIKNQITIVSGLPRSGTSLMMQMMKAGGIEPLTDSKRVSDISNPKGYYEYEPVMSLHKDNTWLELAQNKVLKVVAPLLKFLNPKYRYKIIFMNRDLSEVLKSQQKMIGKDPETLPTKLFESYLNHLQQVEVWKEKEPGVELIYIDYQDVLNNTKETVTKIEAFVGTQLNTDAMINCVDKTLYRTKV